MVEEQMAVTITRPKKEPTAPKGSGLGKDDDGVITDPDRGPFQQPTAPDGMPSTYTRPIVIKRPITSPPTKSK